MGTSRSSSGSPSGVPMVPSWVPDLPASGEVGTEASSAESTANADQESSTTDSPPVEIAPSVRFGSARQSLGRFAGSGDQRDARRALGHYVRTGFGGAGTATRRLGRTVHAAQGLHSALSHLASGQTPPGSPITPDLLAG